MAEILISVTPSQLLLCLGPPIGMQNRFPDASPWRDQHLERVFVEIKCALLLLMCHFGHPFDAPNVHPDATPRGTTTSGVLFF